MNKMPYKDLYIKGEVDCPYCGSMLKTHRLATKYSEKNKIALHYKCDGCYAYWIEEYRLEKVRELKP